MKKVSISKNNAYKKEFLASLEVVLHNIERGRFNPNLDRKRLANVYKSLSDAYEDLDAALGTGKEMLSFYVDNANKALKQLKLKLNQELISEVEQAETFVTLAVHMWISVLGGENVIDADEMNPVNKARRKLNERIDELNLIISDFAKNNSRLEAEIKKLTEASDELDEKIIDEVNERRVNDLYRQLTANKRKITTLDARRSSYSACYNLLDLIKVNALEIVNASDYSEVDLSKAKAYLDINKLREVLSEPEKALNILKMMNKELDAIVNKTKAIDEKINSMHGASSEVSKEALAYKEELIAKRKAKEALSDLGELPYGASVKQQKDTKKSKGE